MLRRLSARNSKRLKAKELYGAIVTQARRPLFFSDMGVPDTPEGRFEMLVVHLVVVLARLKGVGPQSQPLQRALIETFVTDMDDNMREMGVGDLGVARRVKRAAAAFYERAASYEKPLAAADAASLSEQLAARFTPDRGSEPPNFKSLAGEMIAMDRRLADVPLTRFEAGDDPFAQAAARP